MSAQTSSQAPEADRPELSAALHRAAEQALTPLLDADHLVGRVRRKRRTRAVVAAGLAAALLAVGGVGVPRLLAAQPDPANRTHKPKIALADVTEARMISWFESTLPPGGRLSGVTGLGLGQKPPADQVDTGQYVANAAAVDTTANGTGAVHLFLDRWDTEGKTTMPVSCPAQEEAGNSCTVSLWAGGGVLLSQESDVLLPGQSVPMVHRSACLGFRSGGEVCLWTENQTDPGTRPTHREPPLTAAQLRAVVTAPIWQEVMAAIPKQGTLVPKTPRAETVLTRLLPHGYQATPVVRSTLVELGVTSVLTDAQGKGSVFATPMTLGTKASDSVAEFHAEFPAETLFPHGVQLPNGDWLGERQELGRCGPGSVDNEVVVVHGVQWITLDALNCVGRKGPLTRATPILTFAQLATIAESRLWQQTLIM